MDDETNVISEATRRDVFDALRLAEVRWEGRLSETDFLTRVFDLTVLPSHDHRQKNMLGDVVLHRQHFHDWNDDWVYEDGRLNLLRAKDEVFLRFLCEMIHPIVRTNEEEVDQLLALFNGILAQDGFQVSVRATRSGRRIFAGVPMLPANAQGTHQARMIADTLESGHVMDQITRMETSISSDPALAIGSAKEFVESICKAILIDKGVTPTGKETLPKLVHQTRTYIGLSLDSRVEDTVRSTLGALATLTQGLAELRGRLGTGHGGSPNLARPPIPIARFAVGAATSLGVFLWETHQSSLNAVDNSPSA